MDYKIVNFLNGLPKIELHVHLEGSIPIETLWELIKKYNGDKDLGNIDNVREKFKYKDFHIALYPCRFFGEKLKNKSGR